MKRNANPVSLRWLVVAGLATTLSACGGNHDDLYAYIEDVKLQPGGPIEPLPTPRPAPSYEYIPGERRSPFFQESQNPVGVQDPNAVQGPDMNRVREFLEDMPLDSLTMVGTLNNASGTHALVQDRQGRVHPVTIGNHMGFDYGRIVAISEAEITLIEVVTDGLGGWREREATISIGTEE